VNSSLLNNSTKLRSYTLSGEEGRGKEVGPKRGVKKRGGSTRLFNCRSWQRLKGRHGGGKGKCVGEDHYVIERTVGVKRDKAKLQRGSGVENRRNSTYHLKFVAVVWRSGQKAPNRGK